MSGVVQVAAVGSGVVRVVMSDVTLNQILSDEPIEEKLDEEVKADEKEESTETEQSATTEDEQDKTDSESTGDRTDSTPESSDDDSGLTGSELGHYKAYKAERSKRQEEQAKREELERKLAEAQKEPEKTPDVLDDPEGFQHHMDQKFLAVELNARIRTSQALMRREHKDYDEKEQAFLEMAKDDPSLLQQMQSHDLPAEFVYNTVVKHERFEKFDNFDDALKEAIEKERSDIEKRVREELDKEYQEKFGKLSKLPPSGASGSSVADDAAATTPTPLKDILGTPKTT